MAVSLNLVHEIITNAEGIKGECETSTHIECPRDECDRTSSAHMRAHYEAMREAGWTDAQARRGVETEQGLPDGVNAMMEDGRYFVDEDDDNDD